MDSAAFRAAMHRTADLVADYLENVGDYPVLPRIQPGELRAQMPASPPDDPIPINDLLKTYHDVIEPACTHWNHPGFMGYFAITGSGPGIIGETLAAALNINAMLWHTGPAATELEQLVCDWMRQALGLPEQFAGHINDSASMSSMVALAAARESKSDLEIRRRGMAGRSDFAGVDGLLL